MREIRVYLFDDGTVCIHGDGERIATRSRAEASAELNRQMNYTGRRPPRHRSVSAIVTRILDLTARHYHVSVGDILSPSKSSQLTKARVVAYHLMREAHIPELEAIRALRRTKAMIGYYEAALKNPTRYGAFMRENIELLWKEIA